MPQRIQRKRTKGWKMPENAVSVTRPGKFGNPFRVGAHYRRGAVVSGFAFVYLEAFEGYQDATYTTIRTNAEAVEWFRWYVTAMGERTRQEWSAALRGKDLACFCPLDQPCHADVLLEIANG